MLEYIFFAVGFALLLKGAEFLVRGASSLARKLRVSDIVIGLTVVSFGTSAPELVINIAASLKGATDIAIGNILGSNIANMLVIFGACALISPLAVKKDTVVKKLPVHLLAVLVLAVLANDFLFGTGSESFISSTDGIILLLLFSGFMYYVLKGAKDGFVDVGGSGERSILMSSGMVVLGVLALILGAEWVITNAIIIAREIGISDILISLTAIAFGTSLPEIATSVVAVYRKNTGLAVGTAIGSNIFNILFVLGVSSVIRPIAYSLALNTDMFVLGFASIALFVALLAGKKRYVIGRREGAFLLVLYVLYLVFIVLRG